MGKSVFNLLANQIISHHTGLHDYVDAESVIEKRQLPEEINKGDIALNIPQLRKELLESPFSKLKVDMKHFHHLSCMLFSCLVDADRLNTEQFMDVESWKNGDARLHSLTYCQNWRRIYVNCNCMHPIQK